MSIFPPLGIGADALLAEQNAIQVTGHNIANANTPGYSRQTAVLSAIPPAGGLFGRGVTVTDVQQAVDPFLEARRLTTASDLGDATTSSDVLNNVQTLFPVQGTNIGTALQDFFASVEAVSVNPQDLATRTDLLNKAGNLASSFRQASTSLATIQRGLDTQIQQSAQNANSLITNIVGLNKAIAAAKVAGSSINDLSDQRRQALSSLASILDIRVTDQSDGTVNVTTTSGQALVLGTTGGTLSTQVNASNTGLDGAALSDLGLAGPGGVFVPLSGTIGGSVGAQLQLRDTTLPQVSGNLDQLATTLRDAVNAVQTDPAGRDLNNAVGTAFFTGTGAADLNVAITDPRAIAAAQSSNPADNTNALALAAVGNTTYPALGGASLNDYFGSIQATVGSNAAAAADQATVQQNLSSALDAQRESVSGVSLDEEFTNLIRFQRGFQAATQLISVSNKLLDDLLGMVQP